MGCVRTRRFSLVHLRDAFPKRPGCPAGPAHLYHVTGSLEDDWMAPMMEARTLNSVWPFFPLNCWELRASADYVTRLRTMVAPKTVTGGRWGMGRSAWGVGRISPTPAHQCFLCPLAEFQQGCATYCKQDMQWPPVLKQAAWRRREGKRSREPHVQRKCQAVEGMEEDSAPMLSLLQL